MRTQIDLAASQGIDPRTVTEVTGSLNPHPAWRILRAGLAIDPTGRVLPIPNPLPRVLLVPRGEVISEWSTRLAQILAPDFDPAARLFPPSRR